MTSTTTTDGAFLGRQSASATAASAASGPILGRMERLPLSLWHLKVRTIIGTATFFDGIDFLAIALALPVLVGAWHLTPVQVGLLISGQRRWPADRRGRLRLHGGTLRPHSVDRDDGLDLRAHRHRLRTVVG